MNWLNERFRYGGRISGLELSQQNRSLLINVMPRQLFNCSRRCRNYYDSTPTYDPNAGTAKFVLAMSVVQVLFLTRWVYFRIKFSFSSLSNFFLSHFVTNFSSTLWKFRNGLCIHKCNNLNADTCRKKTLWIVQQDCLDLQSEPLMHLLQQGTNIHTSTPPAIRAPRIKVFGLFNKVWTCFHGLMWHKILLDCDQQSNMPLLQQTLFEKSVQPACCNPSLLQYTLTLPSM
jgi:hypothetical protein